MKYVIWEDSKGYRHRSMVKDSDPDSIAHLGIPCDPPNIVEAIDWEAVKREIHNTLVDRGLFSMRDINMLQGNLRSVSQDAIFHRLIELFKLKKD